MAGNNAVGGLAPVTVDSNRGERKYCHNDFLYTRKKTSTVAVYWVCADRDRLICRGSLKTDLFLENPRVSRQYLRTFNVAVIFMFSGITNC